MKDIQLLTTHEQLKTLSDPFRSQLLLRLMEKPMTGQQLSEVFELSRARIHYHLKELEKHELVHIAKKEEKNGIVQKFYQSVSRGFVADRSLLPHPEEMSESVRQMMINMLERSQKRVLSAPEEALHEETGSQDPTEWKYLSAAFEFKATEADFKAWQKKYFALMEELSDMQKQNPSADAKTYYFHSLGIQVDEPLFNRQKSEGES
ncbi:winged helix-turn-helix domain-containing protein [Halobacillus naozhouensis]|uniref:Winged helix-turn-helix domain-containing protein n=1 Tax=Halobacillus naozhouensis TaxID=554880 RepID=A0ABY8J0P3_9BACI|nr:winged helix-turn-helix domain-containing protein [Halobacillus naozhouensis]WFT75124.1 winged helix-turn-helix domain-containing protein [Halobacillus naozhouensis]